MTPLATRLAKQLLLKPSDRGEFWQKESNASKLLAILEAAQFFEVTQILPLLPEIKQVSQDWFESRCFMPAKNTWIEWFHPGGRIALFVTPHQNGKFAVHAFWEECAGNVGFITEQGDYEITGDPVIVPPDWAENYGNNLIVGLLASVHMFVVVINSPKIIDRKEHAPHKGMQRRLKAAGHPIEARGWSELVLELTAPERGGESGAETGLGGKKCLHFCRSFLRIRNGQLERVRDHWRGDAALGIKRKTYTVGA